MRKKDYLLSYLYPVTIEQTESLWNPVLEVVLYGGRYLLNSANANYSQGSLFTMFKRLFRKLKIEWPAIKDVLILGFGTGSVAEIIRRYNPACVIEGVEIDEKVIELGRKYFHTGRLKDVTVYCDNAARFIGECMKKYDLIVIDVYLDLDVPEEAESEEFLINVRNSLRPGGMVVFNKYINSRKSRESASLLMERYTKVFGNLKIINIMTTGKVFTAKKSLLSG